MNYYLRRVLHALNFTGAVLYAASTAAQPAPAQWRVVQFGMPADVRFVFCAAGECPDRTTKTLRVASQARPLPRSYPPRPDDGLVMPTAAVGAPALSIPDVAAHPPARKKARRHRIRASKSAPLVH